MNTTEKKMVEILTELREKYGLAGIKTEFELEGARMEDLCRLKEITMASGLGITLKIGGCEAITGMKAARVIGVSKIVAPMIESAYAMRKFVRAAKSVFPEDELVDIKLAINIETITGYNNYDEMLASPDFDSLGGVVIGRGDLIGSMGHTGFEALNSDEMLDMCNSLFERTKKKRASCECLLGGVPSPESFPFLSRMKPGLVDEYESKKIMFHSTGVYGDKETEGFRKGMEFEYLWMVNKRDYYARIAAEDNRSIERAEQSRA